MLLCGLSRLYAAPCHVRRLVACLGGLWLRDDRTQDSPPGDAKRAVVEWRGLLASKLQFPNAVAGGLEDP